MNVTEYIKSGIIETVVMGLADPQEVAELKRLRQIHPEVEDYAAACEQWLLDSAMRNAVPVPDSVRQRVFHSVSAENTADRAVEGTENGQLVGMKTGIVKRLNTYKYAAAIAVALFVGSTILNLYLYNEYRGARQAFNDLNITNTALNEQNKDYKNRLTSMNRNAGIIASPDYLKVSLAGVTGKENFSATVFWNRKTAELYLSAYGLPAAPSGKQYQLWALVDGKPVDAGVIGDCRDLCAAKNISQAQAFAITLEKEGGSPQPDLNNLYVMGKIAI